jgi:hypothetical protein
MRKAFLAFLLVFSLDQPFAMHSTNTCFVKTPK